MQFELLSLPRIFRVNNDLYSQLLIIQLFEDILNNPLFNKGVSFKLGERDRLRFRGLLPPRRLNMSLQVQRVLEEIRAEESMIRKNEILEDVHDRNETLYHRILVDHIEEMAPIIYTPTVGQACKEFAQRFRRNRVSLLLDH